MTAEVLLQAGDPHAAQQALQEQVKKQAADPKLRVFLFQLMAVNGQWKRSQAQLEIAGQLDSEAGPMVHAYRDVLNCELHREAVFAGKSKPSAGELARMMVHFSESTGSVPTSAFARGLMRAPRAAGPTPGTTSIRPTPSSDRSTSGCSRTATGS